jgi:hypothetical protein
METGHDLWRDAFRRGSVMAHQAIAAIAGARETRMILLRDHHARHGKQQSDQGGEPEPYDLA